MSRFFDGADDKIDCGRNNLFPAVGVITMLGWVLWRTLADTDAEFAGIFSNTDLNGWYHWLFLESTNKLRFYRHASGFSNIEWGTVPTINLWYRIAYTSNGSNFHEAFVNGVSVGTSTAGNAMTNSGGVNILFGQYSSSQSGDTRNFDGSLAHMQSFNRVLTIGEINKAHFFPGCVREKLLGYWPLMGTSSGKELDYSGNKNHGTVTGALPKRENPLVTPYLFNPRFNLPQRKFYNRNKRFVAAAAPPAGTTISSM